MGTSSTQMKAGKLRGVAIATPARASVFPDIPTMDEVGIPGMVISTWYALWAIKRTPKYPILRGWIFIRVKSGIPAACAGRLCSLQAEICAKSEC